MKHLLLALTLLILSSTCLVSQGRHVTLTINSYIPRPVLQTNQFTIGPNETADLVSWPVDPYALQNGVVDIEKDGTSLSFYAESYVSKQTQDSLQNRLTVCGPAVISYRSSYQGQKGFVTFRISPDAFPPDKTFIIPDGTPGAAVTLECSTNLLTWATATNGFYTGTNGAKFFRINAQRAP